MVRPSIRLSQPLRARRVPKNVSRQQRFASSTPGGSGAEKAQDALATAQKYAGEAVAVGKKFLGPLGEKAGNLLGSYRQPIVYNLSVARELLKQVYVAERLQPPTSLSTFTNAYSLIWSRASNPTYWRELFKSGDWVKVGIYGLEAYGIYKIGEIIGRRSLVGYSVQ
ncbi:mitochondrial ATP synthase g subunit-domain-containing protein [Abortiporus biennis]|nr:mitochondrial ATP synthase g subunit-domain-containing protein [Abortiporus biennis]